MGGVVGVSETLPKIEGDVLNQHYLKFSRSKMNRTMESYEAKTQMIKFMNTSHAPKIFLGYKCVQKFKRRELE